jgi:hypothetical protein
MSAKHTPGPWEVVEDDFDEALHITCEARAGMIPICKVDVGYDGPIEDEQHANASLITAAPDLLEALESVTELIELLVLVGDEKPENGSPCQLARAAIAKAKGGAA